MVVEWNFEDFLIVALCALHETNEKKKNKAINRIINIVNKFKKIMEHETY